MSSLQRKAVCNVLAFGVLNPSMQDFTGGNRGLRGESTMIKRGVGVLFGVLLACFTASAYEPGPISRGAFDAPIQLTICPTDVFSSADTFDLVNGLPLLALLNDEAF